MAARDRRLHGAVGGEDVLLLQATLRHLGFDPGREDGIYGPRTADAVRRYQSDRGLAADGVVGPQVWERISAEEGARTRGRDLRVTIVGATAGDDVQEVQTALRNAGFDPGGVDGVFGPRTERAVLDFQIVHGLVADGIVGPATKDALLTRGLRLSSTVAALLREAPESTPAEFLSRLLERHGEYGGGMAGSLVQGSPK